jgi:hypothetical protein
VTLVFLQLELSGLTDKMRVPKITKTSAFCETGIRILQTRYAGRAIVAKSARTSKDPIMFQKANLVEVRNSLWK